MRCPNLVQGYNWGIPISIFPAENPLDLFEAIFTRRSVRKYSGAPVSADDLHTLLRAASYAPSAHNRQPWRFLVVRNPETLAAISAEHPHGKMVAEANLVIIVCGDTTRQTMTGFLAEDCAAAMQNILLAAHGLGLGAVWCGLYPDMPLVDLMVQRFSLPEPILPIGLIAVGHPLEETRSTAERFDPAKVHYEQW